MSIIKLDAIDSTNDFLKGISKEQPLDNFTVVVANTQTRGRGQMGTKWNSESGKNLTMSILIKDLGIEIDAIFVLNAMVSVAIVETLSLFSVPNLSVKWPNDIMSDTKKIAGVLIENSLKTDNSIVSVVGVGMNVNQETFEHLPQASSLFLQTGKIFELDAILNQLLDKIKYYAQLILEKKYEHLWQLYHQYLFKKGVPLAFENTNQEQFMGIIVGVNDEGRLQVQLENDTIVLFSIKEIKMLF